MATTDAAITSSNSTPIPAISGAITTLNNPSSSDSLDPQDISTRAILWKQGRGRSFAFLKPWRERLVIVDHKKMILSYYQIPEGCDLSSIFLIFAVDLIGEINYHQLTV